MAFIKFVTDSRWWHLLKCRKIKRYIKEYKETKDLSLLVDALGLIDSVFLVHKGKWYTYENVMDTSAGRVVVIIDRVNEFGTLVSKQEYIYITTDPIQTIDLDTYFTDAIDRPLEIQSSVVNLKYNLGLLADKISAVYDPKFKRYYKTKQALIDTDLINLLSILANKLRY